MNQECAWSLAKINSYVVLTLSNQSLNLHLFNYELCKILFFQTKEIFCYFYMCIFDFMYLVVKILVYKMYLPKICMKFCLKILLDKEYRRTLLRIFLRLYITVVVLLYVWCNKYFKFLYFLPSIYRFYLICKYIF